MILTRLVLVAGLLLAALAAMPAPSPAPFTLCKSTYALCTTAACTPVAG